MIKNKQMKKIFVKSSELQLVNGGYVVAGKTQTPVFNVNFIEAQKRAERVVLFAEKAKGKDFIGKTADNIEDVVKEVDKVLSKSDVKYLAEPKEVKLALTSKLKEEALAFIGHLEETSKVEKINKFLQQFNVIQEFEEFGLYFEEDICKLNKIYTIKEIVEAVEEVINLVD